MAPNIEVVNQKKQSENVEKVEKKPVNVVNQKNQSENVEKVEKKAVNVSSPKKKAEEVVTSEREYGTMKWYNRQKRFGVVIADKDGEEFLVLQSSIKFYKSYGLWVKDRVEFAVGPGRDGKEVAFEVTRGPMCYTCGREGHISRFCVQRRGRKQGEGNGGARSGSDKGACYGCGKPGHVQRNCPGAQQVATTTTTTTSGGSCYGCGETGHFKRDCPNKNISN